MLLVLAAGLAGPVVAGGAATLLPVPVAARREQAAAEPAPGPGVGYGWPILPAPSVARSFEAPPFRYGRGHRGVDLVAAPGSPVRAAREGRITYAGLIAGHGVISIEHADGLRTTYEPVSPTVPKGAAVARGEPIGMLEAGHPGCPVVACLHWGLRRGSGTSAEYLDPLVLLGPRHVRLLPLPDSWPD